MQTGENHSSALEEGAAWAGRQQEEGFRRRARGAAHRKMGEQAVLEAGSLSFLRIKLGNLLSRTQGQGHSTDPEG